MRYPTIKALLVSLAILGASGAMAQNLRSSYFMEGMTYRHQLNPAFMGESNYINMPLFVLGNFNVGTQANIGVDNFLYKYNKPGYKLTTFMNPDISNEAFLGSLHPNNRINMNLSMPIIAFGYKAYGGFNTFEIGVKTQTSMNLPYELFDFMKTGMSDAAGTHYNVKDLSIRSNAYLELALGHAREIIEDRLSVGAKVKLLVGAGNAEAKIKNMDISMSEDQWNIQAEGTVEGSIKNGYFTAKEPDKNGKQEIDGFEVETPGVAGFGVGFDLGAVYKMDDFVEGLTLSASLLDLGFIKWNNGIKARMQDQYTFDGFEYPIVIDPADGDPGDIDNQIDKIGDDLEEFIKLYDDGKVSSRTTRLSTTMHVGAEYALPYYKKLKFGLLSSTHFNKPFTWTEARISANVAPLSWFEASVNYAYSTFGSSLGWVLNFHPNGFNFFIGTDHMLTNVTPQYVPVGHANMNVNIGFNITWGKQKKVAKAKQAATEPILEY